MEGFGEGLERVWEGIWKDLDVFVQVVGRFWEPLDKCGPAGTYSLYWTPALIREASQFVPSPVACDGVVVAGLCMDGVGDGA